jgi:hypothetical protein
MARHADDVSHSQGLSDRVPTGERVVRVRVTVEVVE